MRIDIENGLWQFEEDIAAPFRPRLSNSCTVRFSAGDAPPAPASLADAAAWFPGLRKLNRDGLRCAAETPLAVMHGVEVYERVWEGPEWKLSGDAEATVAVILWSAGPDGRNLAGELSFRLGDGQQQLDIPPAAAAQLHHCFLAVQSLDWCLPESRTKTQLAYGAR